MEQKNLKATWKQMNNTLESSLKLNNTLLIDVARLKIKAHLNSMKPIKWFTIAIGVLWVGFVDTVVLNSYGFASPFFIASAIAQSLITKIAIGLYVYQLVLLRATDFSAPILNTQLRILKIKTSSLWVSRILFLQLPFWTTFYLNKNILANNSGLLLFVQILATLAFTAASIWLFVNIRPSNYHKKWFKMLFNGSEWTPLIESLRILDELKQNKLVLKN